ncbi:MAG: glycosyltransferase [Candidatus Omnitrophica bacterium]|nr:glycosyltransferase [Candidatus Omnitrophota bacterium]
MLFFSIIVPTRNRGKLLVESAIPSILDQDFDSYEIVICDNNSSDNTKVLVENLMRKYPKIRYVYSPVWIPKEKFFEFSLKQAKGEYSILFFDDDVFIKNTLKFCYNVLSKIPLPVFTFSNKIVYFYSDWHISDNKNTLKIPFHTKEIIIKDSKKLLKKIFDTLDLIPGTPDVTNSFYRTPFILELIDKYGTLFPYGHMGDYNIACYTLANTEYILFYDGPIIIFGHWSQNTTQQLRFLKTTMNEYKEWTDWAKENLLKDMPFKEYTFSNCIVATLSKMKQQLNLPYSIDFTKYIQKIYNDLLYIKAAGIDTSYLKEKFIEFIKERNINLRKIIGIKNVSRPEIDFINFMPTSMFKGEKYGFNNILEARFFFDSLKKKTLSTHTFEIEILRKFTYYFLKLGSKIIQKLFGLKFYKKLLKTLKIMAIYILSKSEE